MKTGVEKIIQAKGGDAPAKNQTGVQKIIELLGGDPPAKNQTGVDKIVEILENGGGGGNPNRVEEIEGTLANPFGEAYTQADFAELATAVENKNASVIIDFVFQELPIHVYLTSNNEDRIWRLEMMTAYLGASEDAANISAYGMWRAETGVTGISLNELTMQDSGVVTDLKTYASAIPTTLTIIWHPLPDQS